MAVGNAKAMKPRSKTDPIVRAIAEAERQTAGEIRVHLSKQFIEKDVYAHAEKIFAQYGMTRTAQRNAVLIYANLRKRQFAIVGDEGIHERVGQTYWEELARGLREDLLSTNAENAIALAVRTVGLTLARFFPLEAGAENPNELSDEVSED